MYSIWDTYSLRGSMVIGRECLEFPPVSKISGGDSNSSEWALWEPSGLGWTGPGLARALWMRMCRGIGGGWLGGSVVGLGGSVCTVGTGPEEVVLGSLSDWTLGGDGGTWEGGEGKGSVEVGGAAAIVLSSLSSPLRRTGGTDTGAAVGSEVVHSGTWLGGDGSAELRLVTGVILFGGVGGERLAGAGTTMTVLPGCESSAVNKAGNNNNQFCSYRMVTNATCSHNVIMNIHSVEGEISFNKNKQKSKHVSNSFSLGDKKTFPLWLSWLLSQWRVTHTY